MLDVAKKDPMTIAPAGRDLSPEPREEEPIGLPTPNESPASDTEEAAHLEELALMQRKLPLAPPAFALHGLLSLAHTL